MNQRHYTLVLNTDSGSRRTLRINNPNVDIPVATLETAVEQLIANDIFDDTRGALESLNRLEKTVVEITSVL